jgi:hypothetical protein
MNIDDLLTKYFEGETTGEEERLLRSFFASDRVPPRLNAYRPLFAWADEEIRKKRQREAASGRAAWKRYYYLFSGMAAAVFLLLGINRALFRTEETCLCAGSFAVVNGKCYTDVQKARSLAFEALQEVATPAEEYFPAGALFDEEE